MILCNIYLNYSEFNYCIKISFLIYIHKYIFYHKTWLRQKRTLTCTIRRINGRSKSGLSALYARCSGNQFTLASRQEGSKYQLVRNFHDPTTSFRNVLSSLFLSTLTILFQRNESTKGNELFKIVFCEFCYYKKKNSLKFNIF